MTKKVKLLDYKGKATEVEIKDFENVSILIYEILSGDGTLIVVYKDKHREYFDSSDDRVMNYHDGLWVIDPKDIDVLNKLKNNHDTDILDDLEVIYDN